MTSVEGELQWRLDRWHRLQQSPNWPAVTKAEIQSLDLYAGQAGVYRAKTRTGSIAPSGVAVSIKNAPGHYSDEIDGDLLIYDYPNTRRGAGHDRGEIESLVAARQLGLPIFVMSDLPNGKVHVQLGWVELCELAAGASLINLAEENPGTGLQIQDVLSTPFVARVARQEQESMTTRVKRDKQFKYIALTVHQGTCAVTDIKVAQMLDAAHVIPVNDHGSDHPLNSLLLNAAAHRAFDARLWAIHPETMMLATRDGGPSLEEMRISRTSVKHLPALPHPESLEHRWKMFERATGGRILLAG